jgi:cytochrome c oxidase assembly protein subunit 11
LRRNNLLFAVLGAVVVGMVCLSFAAVPLYRAFCQATGFGGTTQRREQAADRVLDRTVEIRFNADVNRDLPWAFRPDQRSVTVRIGETGLATFHAQNLTGETLGGAALYNVTPEKVGRYFVKMQCFCFTEQVLRPHEAAELPVAFYVDPAIARDRNLDDVSVITLSYTFFKAQSQAFDRAVAAEPPVPARAAKTPEAAAPGRAALAAGPRVE